MKATAATSICGLTSVKTGNPYYVNFGLFHLPLAIPVCPVSPAQAPTSEGVKCLLKILDRFQLSQHMLTVASVGQRLKSTMGTA